MQIEKLGLTDLEICAVFYLHNFFYGYFVYNAKMIILSCEFFGGFHNFFYGKIKKIKKISCTIGILIFLQIHVLGYMVDENIFFLDFFWIFSFKSRHFKRKSPGKIKELKKMYLKYIYFTIFSSILL